MSKLWTVEEFNHAKQLQQSGATAVEIAKIIGRPVDGVRHRLNRGPVLANGSYQISGANTDGLTGRELIEARQKAMRVHEMRRPGETLADCQRRIG